VVIVSSGVKSLLDVEATAEMLETLGVPVLGWRTATMPRFYDADGGPPVTDRVESAEEALTLARVHWELGGCGMLVARPPDTSIDVDDLIDEALEEAEREGIGGQAVTPFVLSRLHERSDGRTLEVNKELAAANAGLAGELAVGAA
jgi:pseudouridine-5'-phosphate glycosidase